MIKYVFRNIAEYVDFIDQLTRTRNEPGAVANNRLTVRTVNYIYSRTSGLDPHPDMYLFHWTLDDIQEAIESPVYIRPDGYVALEMPAIRYPDGESLNEFAEKLHLPVGIAREVKLASKTHPELDIARSVQLQMYRHLLNSQHGLASRNIPMVAARCLPKSLSNTIHGNYRVVQEVLDHIKEVNDSMFKRIPDITKVIHNAPATIVFWSDGEKTVVKAENEVYDPEKGIAMAITKKVLGNKGNYYNTIRKWLPKEEE